MGIIDSIKLFIMRVTCRHKFIVVKRRLAKGLEGYVQMCSKCGKRV